MLKLILNDPQIFEMSSTSQLFRANTFETVPMADAVIESNAMDFRCTRTNSSDTPYGVTCCAFESG